MTKKRLLKTAMPTATLSASLLALAVTLLAACEQAALPAVPFADAPGTVTVRVAAAGAPETAPSPGAARTVVPVIEIASAFDKYDLTFSGGGKTVDAEDIDTPIKLPEGAYTLTVTARKSGAAIAQGTASVVIDSDTAAEAAVFLTPVTGGAEGEFSYDVTLPAGAKGALTLTGPATKEITLTEGGNNATVNLPPGEYRLAMTIDKGAGMVKFTNEVMYLYSTLKSTFTRDFSSVQLIKSVEGILAFLSDAEPNDAGNPYTLDLSGLALAELATGTGSSVDSLGLLYEALNGRYVNLDLSGCTETVLANTSSIVINKRKNKDKIVSVILPDSLTSIGNFAFQGCTSLASIDLPDSLTSIGSSAFYGCTSLVSIDLPDTLT
jgi:hypothetical protein